VNDDDLAVAMYESHGSASTRTALVGGGLYLETSPSASSASPAAAATTTDGMARSPSWGDKTQAETEYLAALTALPTVSASVSAAASQSDSAGQHQSPYGMVHSFGHGASPRMPIGDAQAHDDFVSATNALTAAAIKADFAEVAAYFARVDTDGNGQISKAVLRAAMAADPAVHRLVLRTTLDADQLWQLIDTENSGAITPLEFLKGLGSTTGVGLAAEIAAVENTEESAGRQQSARSADTTTDVGDQPHAVIHTTLGGDDTCTLESKGARAPPSAPRASLFKMFQNLDTDADGRVSRDELATGVARSPDLKQLVADSGLGLTELMHSLDTDGDGTVTIMEFLKGIGLLHQHVKVREPSSGTTSEPPSGTSLACNHRDFTPVAHLFKRSSVVLVCLNWQPLSYQSPSHTEITT
jgi:Ca2+-binding EF-hand superfamily protein